MKTEDDGKTAGEEGILENAHVRSAGGYSKSTWLVDSSSAPHILQHKSQSIPWVLRFFETGSVPDKISHTKYLNFGGHFSFQANTNKGFTFGPKIVIIWPLSGKKDSTLNPELNEYLPLRKAPPDCVWLRASTDRQTPNDLHIIRMYKSIYKIHIPWTTNRIDKMFHLKERFNNWIWFFGNVDLEWGAGIHGSVYTEIDRFPIFLLAIFNQRSSWADASPPIRGRIRYVFD